MTRIAVPSFRGWSALVLHRPDEGIDRLARQLDRLGLAVTAAWPECPAAPSPDIVFFDADQGYDGLFPWPAGAPPMPLVAILGSEAPGRVEWLMEQGATGLLQKPVQAAHVYPVVVAATVAFTRRAAEARELADLKERLQLRAVVVEAVLDVMAERGTDVAGALRLIRMEAMEGRETLEAVCVRRHLQRAAGRPGRAAGKR